MQNHIVAFQSLYSFIHSIYKNWFYIFVNFFNSPISENLIQWKISNVEKINIVCVKSSHYSNKLISIKFSLIANRTYLKIFYYIWRKLKKSILNFVSFCFFLTLSRTITRLRFIFLRWYLVRKILWRLYCNIKWKFMLNIYIYIYIL